MNDTGRNGFIVAAFVATSASRSKVQFAGGNISNFANNIRCKAAGVAVRTGRNEEGWRVNESCESLDSVVKAVLVVNVGG